MEMVCTDCVLYNSYVCKKWCRDKSLYTPPLNIELEESTHKTKYDSKIDS